MADAQECDRCGKIAEGAYRLMFYKRPFPMLPEVAREFFCHRCLRLMRTYAIIGFSLLGIVVGALTVPTVWAVSQAP